MKHIIIGMGSIGKRHYRLLQEAGEDVMGVDVGGIVETDDIRKPYINYDMVWICTPTNIHYKDAERTILSDVKNVFIEKPITQNLTQLEIIKNLSGKRVDGYQPKIWSACNYRFHPAVKVLKDNLDKVGKILYSRMHYSHYLPYQRENWKEYMKDTNIIMDAGWHFVDLGQFLFGKICQSTHIGAIRELDNIKDMAQIGVFCNHDIPVMILLDYLRRDKSWGINVVGTRGTLELCGLGKNPELAWVAYFKGNDVVDLWQDYVNSDEMYYNQLSYLLKEDWKSNIDEAKEVMKICS